MAKQEVVKAASTAVAVSTRPDFVSDKMDGLEEIGFRDMVIPRMGLCQTNTRQRQKANAGYIAGLEEGDFFNNVTGKIYGKIVRIVPLFFFHSRIMFRDMKEGGGIICQAPDGRSCRLNNGGPCLHANWGPNNEPPECTELYNYPALVYEGPGSQTKDWVIVSIKTTGIPAGRNLNSLMRLRRAPAYAGVYELESVPDKDASGNNYFTWSSRNAVDDSNNPMWVDSDIYNRAKLEADAIREGLQAGTITIAEEDPDSPDAEKEPAY